jgi:LysM repeat protein
MKITLPLESIKKYGGEQNVAVHTSPVEKPVETVAETHTTKASEDEYIVQQKDNYYRISKQFNITKEELFALNPGLEEKGLKPGETIKIKKSNKNSGADVFEENSNPKTK